MLALHSTSEQMCIRRSTAAPPPAPVTIRDPKARAAAIALLQRLEWTDPQAIALRRLFRAEVGR